MKRKMILFAMAVSACMLSASVFAEDAAGEISAEELYQKAQEYSASVESMSGVMNMKFDVGFSITSNGESIMSSNFLMNGDFDLQEIISPMTMSMMGTYAMEVLGESMNMDMQMYMAENEENANVFDTYTNVTADGSESGWQHVSSDMTELLNAYGVSSLKDLSTLSLDDMLGEDVELDWTVEDQGDTWKLALDLGFSDLLPVVESAMSAETAELPEEVWSMVENILGAFRMNMSYDIDKETYAILSGHVDFNGSDIGILNSLISGIMAAETVPAEEGETEAEVPGFVIDSLNSTDIDFTFSYNDVDEILIPAEALAGTTIDVEELESELAE